MLLYDAFGQVLLRGCAREACREREMRPSVMRLSVDLGMLPRSAVQLLLDLSACEWPVSAIPVASGPSMISKSEQTVAVAIICGLSVRYKL